uniref:Uncharacterized protein n=1 Tax=Anguilla anguilla TaxID=7936 RepID=A0A0E9SS01_ANGAN
MVDKEKNFIVKNSLKIPLMVSERHSYNMTHHPSDSTDDRSVYNIKRSTVYLQTLKFTTVCL